MCQGVMMLVDYRENRSKVPRLLAAFNVSLKIADLMVDYAIDKDCFVERKTINDFVTSIADGRLFKQVTYLSSSCLHPLLILEGGGLYLHGRMPENAIRGVMLWISVKQKVPILRTRNEHDTACMLRLLDKKFGYTSDVTTDRALRKQKVQSSWQQQMAVLSQIPGIGRQTAYDLLRTFSSVAGIMQAQDAELVSLPRIGNERLAAIRQIFPQYCPLDSRDTSHV